MTSIAVTVQDSAGASATATATFTVSSATFVTPKCAPTVWSGATPAFGFEINGGWQQWLSPTKLSSVKAKGFDGLRMSFALGVVMNQSASQQQASVTSFVNLCKAINAAGLQCIAVGNADTGGFSGASVFDGLTGPNWTKLKAVWAQLATQLAPFVSQIAFEFVNEPQCNLSDKTKFYAFMNDIRTAIRQVAPVSIIYVTPDFLQSPDQMIGYDATMWPASDPNLYAAFHNYGEPHGQQGMIDGYHNWYHRIPVPPPADLNTRVAEMNTQLSAYNTTLVAAGIDPATKTGQISNIHWYYGDNSPWSTVNVPRDQAWLTSQYASYAAWGKKFGVKVVDSEGGCTGDNLMVSPASLGADRQSRINGYIMIRTACAANGIPWCPQTLFGVDGKQGQGLLTNDANLVWDDGMVAAVVNGAGWVPR